MADISEVLVVLAAQAAAAVYPNGTGQASVANCDIRVYPGWPNAAALDNDLLAGKVNISVYPTQSEKNTTRYERRWQTQVRNTPTVFEPDRCADYDRRLDADAFFCAELGHPDRQGRIYVSGAGR